MTIEEKIWAGRMRVKRARDALEDLATILDRGGNVAVLIVAALDDANQLLEGAEADFKARLAAEREKNG